MTKISVKNLNGEKVKDPQAIISKEAALFDNKTVIKRGKRNYYVIAQ